MFFEILPLFCFILELVKGMKLEILWVDREEEGMEDDPKFDASLERVNWSLTETLC